MNTQQEHRSFDQPERDWLHQLRRRRAVWLGISFFVLVVTVVGLSQFFSVPDPEAEGPPGTGAIFVLHGRNAGGAAAQVLVSALTREGGLLPSEATRFSDELEDDEEVSGGPVENAETGPGDAPFLRRKTLTSSQVTELASRYFLEGDVLRALRLAWCLSRFDPGAIDSVSGRVGLYQHDLTFWQDHAQLAGFRGYDPFDPEASTAVAAYLVYEGEGWQTWNCPT